MRTVPLWFALCCGWIALTGWAEAAVIGEPVVYRHGNTVLEGYVAYDDAVQGKRPGVIVVHEWRGLNDYAKGRARQLAEMGYIAMAIDMYGQAVYAADHAEAGKLSGALRNDRAFMRERAQAGLEVFMKHPLVDTRHLAAIGYCFGGTTVLELARSGAPLAGVASFHGGLNTPQPGDVKQIKGKVLVLHGANDPHVTQAEVAAFEAEMRAAGADYRVVQYPDAVHSFTVPEAGNDPSSGAAYNAAADRASWMELTAFLRELLLPPTTFSVTPACCGQTTTP